MTTTSQSILETLRGAPLIDGHNDLLWALRLARAGIAEPVTPDIDGPMPDLMTDLPRMRAGGVGGQFWSVYVPSTSPEPVAVRETFEQVDALQTMLARYPDGLQLARTADDVERIAMSGRIASMIGVEGGHSIGSSLGVLRVLASFGAGYLTLTHNDDTPWADSATGVGSHGGLTRFGEEVVRELNRSGMLVDLSHTSPDTMRHALAVSEAPAFFSHSSARALADVTRNVPDDVLETVAGTGGVVMVTFVPSFLTREGAVVNAAGWDETARLRALYAGDADAVKVAMDVWFAANPDPAATIGDVADHIDHIREVAGIDHIGIGGDHDGVASMPLGLEDVACYPALFEELSARGYGPDDLMAIAGRNVLRVMRATEAVAARLVAERPPSTATIEQLDAALA